MKTSKRTKLEAAGWRVGSASEFLELSQPEQSLVEVKLALAARLRERRRAQDLTQAELGRRIGSSQSRVAKMEVADPSVSVDLLMRSLLSLGASRKDIANAVGSGVGRTQAARSPGEHR